MGSDLRPHSSWVNGLGFIPAPSSTPKVAPLQDSYRSMGTFCLSPPARAEVADWLQAKAPEIWAPALRQCSAVRTHPMGTNNTEGTLAFELGPAPGGSIPHCSAHFYSRINVQSLECQGACTGHPQTHRKKKKIKQLLPNPPQLQPHSSSLGYREALGWVPLAHCWLVNAGRHFVSHYCPF